MHSSDFAVKNAVVDGIVPAHEGTDADARNSPCTPPLQCIATPDGRAGDGASGAKLHEALDWSPQTPETMTVTLKDVQDSSVAVAPSGVGNTRGATSEEVAAAAAPAPGAHAEAEAVPHDSSAASGYVDPTQGCSDDTPVAPPAAAPAEAHQPPRLSSVFFPSSACDASSAASLVTAVAHYCDVVTLVELMRVDRAAYKVATSDKVWVEALIAMNLSPLVFVYERSRNFYDFFVKDVITTRALHGHYTFQAASLDTGSRGSASGASGTRGVAASSSRDDDGLTEDIFNIASLQLLISSASLGQANHLIGRVQLLLTYKNESMEVLQGSCRFSVHRRCFSLCCSAFGTVKRGPVFTVTLATVRKPWVNEGFEHFSEHKNGLRLVMTPMLWEGRSPGSQITEHDILVVSRPKPVPSPTTSTTTSATASKLPEMSAAAATGSGASSTSDAPAASRG